MYSATKHSPSLKHFLFNKTHTSKYNPCIIETFFQWMLSRHIQLAKRYISLYLFVSHIVAQLRASLTRLQIALCRNKNVMFIYKERESYLLSQLYPQVAYACRRSSRVCFKLVLTHNNGSCSLTFGAFRQ